MTRIRPRRTLGAGLAVTALLATTVACAPGEEGGSGTETSSEDVTTDISEVGDVTLTVWDQEVRGGQAEQIAALNEAFMEKYPNVTIDRTKRSFTDLQRTLRNAITSDDAPDVVQANNGRTDMGAFVENGLLQSLDGYAEAYGWTERFPESVRSLASYSDDGATFGEGNLYGLPQVGELVGRLLQQGQARDLGPRGARDHRRLRGGAGGRRRTPASCRSSSATSTAGRASTTSASCRTSSSPRDDIRNLGFGREGASWTSEENVQAARDLQRVGRTPATSPPTSTAWATTRPGRTSPRATGVFLVAGTWLQADLDDAMGEDVGFFLPPVGESGERAVTGGTGLPFSITEASDDADVAAAYIDFITSDEAMQMIQDAGNLPVVGGSTRPGRGRGGRGARRLDDGRRGGRPRALPRLRDPGLLRPASPRRCRSSAPARSSDDEFLGTLEEEYTSFVSGSDADAGDRPVTPTRPPPGGHLETFPGGPPAGRSVRGAAAAPRGRARGSRGWSATPTSPRRCVVFGLFLLAPLGVRRAALVLRVGRPGARHVGRPGQLRRGLHRPRAAGAVRRTPWCWSSSSACCRCAWGCCWPRS